MASFQRQHGDSSGSPERRRPPGSAHMFTSCGAAPLLWSPTELPLWMHQVRLKLKGCTTRVAGKRPTEGLSLEEGKTNLINRKWSNNK